MINYIYEWRTMLDYRMMTFLKLYETMNYRVTAELLNVTQPAVTQHIHYLENQYGCKLFHYEQKKLTRTKEGEALLKYAQSALYNDLHLRKKLTQIPTMELRIGATKTIGEFIIRDKMKEMLKKQTGNFTFIIDNTTNLLKRINDNELDFALIEGYFDKTKYDCRLFRQEPFVGICHCDHPFANKIIEMDEMITQTLILREDGSGTRHVLEQLLLEHNLSPQSFSRQLCISDFTLIKELVSQGMGISLVYKSVVLEDDKVALFYIKQDSLYRQLNYVFLKNTNIDKLIADFEGQ